MAMLRFLVYVPSAMRPFRQYDVEDAGKIGLSATANDAITSDVARIPIDSLFV